MNCFHSGICLIATLTFLGVGEVVGEPDCPIRQRIESHDFISRARYPIATTIPNYPGMNQSLEAGRLFGLTGFINWKNAEDKTGIYLSEPFDPAKTPILMVHGLLDDPYTWKKLTYGLLLDPQIRERYQFWYFAYPSSTPVIGSSAIFRRHFQSFMHHLEVTHRVSMKRRVVLIGHSMGGILCKSLVSSSGTVLWDSAFTVPIEELSCTEPQREFIAESFFFEPCSYICKAIFMASPHRGSLVAESRIGELGIKLARPPALIDTLIDELGKEENRPKVQPGFRRFLTNPVNSVSTLQPSAPISQNLADLPIDPEVSFHSIAGRTRKEDGDGVVPISSTQLKGAACEVVIRSKHNVHKQAVTIDLVNLILKYHSGLYSETDVWRIASTLDIVEGRHQ